VLGASGRYRGGLVVSFGTDGVDGASEAAGALYDDAVHAGATAGEVAAALAANDSDRFFARHRARIVTGPTGTNVADLAIWLR
jgi:glycerate-2-kinase